MKRNNKRLYESIMKDVAKTVKRHLNENYGSIRNDKINFDELNSISEYNLSCLQKDIKKLKQMKDVNMFTPIIFETMQGEYYIIGDNMSVLSENINGKDVPVIVFHEANYDYDKIRTYDESGNEIVRY